MTEIYSPVRSKSNSGFFPPKNIATMFRRTNQILLEMNNDAGTPDNGYRKRNRASEDHSLSPMDFEDNDHDASKPLESGERNISHDLDRSFNSNIKKNTIRQLNSPKKLRLMHNSSIKSPILESKDIRLTYSFDSEIAPRGQTPLRHKKNSTIGNCCNEMNIRFAHGDYYPTQKILDNSYAYTRSVKPDNYEEKNSPPFRFNNASPTMRPLFSFRSSPLSSKAVCVGFDKSIGNIEGKNNHAYLKSPNIPSFVVKDNDCSRLTDDDNSLSSISSSGNESFYEEDNATCAERAAERCSCANDEESELGGETNANASIISTHPTNLFGKESESASQADLSFYESSSGKDISNIKPNLPHKNFVYQFGTGNKPQNLFQVHQPRETACRFPQNPRNVLVPAVVNPFSTQPTPKMNSVNTKKVGSKTYGRSDSFTSTGVGSFVDAQDLKNSGGSDNESSRKENIYPYEDSFENQNRVFLTKSSFDYSDKLSDLKQEVKRLNVSTCFDVIKKENKSPSAPLEPSPTDILDFPFQTNSSRVPPSICRSSRKKKIFDSRLYESENKYLFGEHSTKSSASDARGNSFVRKKDYNDPQENSYSHNTFSRFESDFEIMTNIGSGTFGSVYKCRSRIDGCDYAIKVSKRKSKGAASRDIMLREVYALAALSDQASGGAFHIVRYHQAWMEESTLYIQTELCDGNIKEVNEMGGLNNESSRFAFLRQMLLALELLHKNSLVHLDIKPENIFIKNGQFKLGDFGLANNLQCKQFIEGDSRYMSMELLLEDHSNLTKSDIFSLGATLYEICLGRMLKPEGVEWTNIRQGKLSPMPKTGIELRKIISRMMSATSADRPAAKELLKFRSLMSAEQQELIIAKNKAAQANSVLQAQMNNMKGKSTLVRRSTWTG
eukprot:CAMPEP_0194280988 /NCGR_PEP_ID=MMETSP0169-20130528/19424_1 /TAXON_ID=218684 /ORGANISM="Corethron pennatum, Strain L29A3" /LENGTH=895 /DNA_ID=CAMNT_0039025911 /DNA_START=54 /DNA_END=2741 /DNA_ORIENTATION=+